MAKVNKMYITVSHAAKELGYKDRSLLNYHIKQGKVEVVWFSKGHSSAIRMIRVKDLPKIKRNLRHLAYVLKNKRQYNARIDGDLEF